MDNHPSGVIILKKNDYLCNPKLPDTGEIERRLSFISTGFRLAKTDFVPNNREK